MNIVKKIKKSIKRIYFDKDKEFILECLKKKKTLDERASETVNLVLRGSNADYGFYANSGNSSLNMGLTSSDLYTSYKLYQVNMERFEKLKNIIVYINAATPGFNLSQTGENYRCMIFREVFLIEHQSRAKLCDIREEELIKKCRKYSSEQFNIDKYFGYEKKSFYLKMNAEQRKSTHLRENKREPDQLVWLEKLIKLAGLNDINVYCVITPIKKEFKAIMPNKEELFKKFYDIEYTNYKVLDYYDSSDFNDGDLGDTDHLNELGAIKITGLILKDIGL